MLVSELVRLYACLYTFRVILMKFYSVLLFYVTRIGKKERILNQGKSTEPQQVTFYYRMNKFN